MKKFIVFVLVCLFIVAIIISRSFCIVPQQEVWIVENLGKFSKKLDAGLHFLFPFVLFVANSRLTASA